MQSVHPLSQQKPAIWATETMAAQGDGNTDRRHGQSTDILYQFLIKLEIMRYPSSTSYNILISFHNHHTQYHLVDHSDHHAIIKTHQIRGIAWIKVYKVLCLNVTHDVFAWPELTCSHGAPHGLFLSICSVYFRPHVGPFCPYQGGGNGTKAGPRVGLYFHPLTLDWDKTGCMFTSYRPQMEYMFWQPFE